LTLYVESNFVLEIVLGQEEAAQAERLLVAAEAKTIRLALPAFSLNEPLVRFRRGIRDRNRLVKQLNSEIGQLARSDTLQSEVDSLRAVPNLFAKIEQREMDRLTRTVERLLATARQIALDQRSFQAAIDYQIRFGLEIEDAIILALVVADLNSPLGTGQHLFANRNLKDFDDPDVIEELRRLGCDTAHSCAEAVNRLGVR
jgi:predicted nucleic acid-binding protein